MAFYESTPGSFRGFCSVCGSQSSTSSARGPRLQNATPTRASRYGIALAALDDDPGLRPAAHTFVAYKAPWFEITDDLPQYPESRQSRKASPVSDGLLA